MIITPTALWAVFLTYYGGFMVLFLVAFAGLVATIPPTTPAGR
jgi:hypothetical protein